MAEFSTQLIILLLLIGFNGVLALAELALISARKARLQQMATEGSAGAKTALDLANAPTDFLSTIQIGITLVGILTGAFSATALADDLAVFLDQVPALIPYSKYLSSALVLVFSTYLTIVFGELVPKRIAIGHADNIASKVSRPMSAFTKIALPFVRLLSFSTDSVVRILGLQNSDEQPVTEEEVKILIEQGTQAGVFKKSEEAILKRVFRLGDQIVGDLMTTRLKMVALDIDETLEKNVRKMLQSPHSYFPVYQRNHDNIIGVVSIKLLWAQLAKQQSVSTLKDCMLKPLFVAESMLALKALELFKQTGRHMAMVVDEYGGTAGIVTLIDILEAIVGNLPSSDEQRSLPAKQREDGSWLIDGMLPIDDLKEVLNIPKLEGEELGDYQTLGGFIMARMGRIPSEGEYFNWGGFRFEVVDMDGMRVDKVLIIPAKS